ncbi:c-type cytochrome domain-containing protein [Flavilitoribacter nigricans]|uniref:Cytochrome C n=1 Tax=Flavilitoribacter nigricans (strain ATCC 23147 / DSM 23189 / NBRC 102662 / NCIMB 1420 / SS-2) TaxID=1122177 RepID=A0A2D0N4Q5_FLAN2|nr:c-type cytochrome domain-containing protein [Flavilitoribacter nigricans]PHN03417.1 cytochrome C [Flavilitoribacter nigricans DSM 23189 = NBRC 102662]
MKKNRLFLLLLVIGILPFLPEPTSETAGAWTGFLGRFHILILHFPVVLVLALAGLELARTRRPQWDTGRLARPFWVTTLGSCLLSVLAGYMLYRTGEYQGELVRDHLWGGVLLTVFLSLAAFLRFQPTEKTSTTSNILQNGLLALSALLVIYTSHQGGSLTHGPDFLTEYAPALRVEAVSPLEQKPKAELLVYQDLIVPVLDKRCFSCHNEYKTKGDLLMTSFPELMRGGKSGKTMLVAGEPKESELYHRITLPETDDDHMPPPEKPGLEEDEIALMRWWIESGADPEMQLREGPESPEGKALIDRLLPNLFQARRLQMRREKEQEALLLEIREKATPLGLTIEPDREAPGFFAIGQTIPPQPVNDGAVSELLEYAEAFSKVSLPGALITDDGLFELSKMTHLNRLYLPKTCIKGPGLAYLQSLPTLEEINLSYTFLDDAGALNLLHLPQVKKVYLFGTEIEPNVLKALRRNLPDVEILEEEGPYF